MNTKKNEPLNGTGDPDDLANGTGDGDVVAVAAAAAAAAAVVVPTVAAANGESGDCDVANNCAEEVIAAKPEVPRPPIEENADAGGDGVMVRGSRNFADVGEADELAMAAAAAACAGPALGY